MHYNYMAFRSGEERDILTLNSKFAKTKKYFYITFPISMCEDKLLYVTQMNFACNKEEKTVRTLNISCEGQILCVFW